MKRREFINWVGVGTLATSLPVILAACSSPPSETSADPQTGVGKAIDAAQGAADTLETGGGFISVGTVAALDAAGFLAIQDPAPVIVIRNPADATQVVAFNSVCNHKQCNVDWKGDQGIFFCACHDSVFTATGELQKGPATAGLPAYESKVEGDQVMVKVA
ncbi:ubiquinol-cytochrome c reductase iron-sulfur subunit [Prochlorothrix hollandica]|uniref:Rieske domain-containing protein n=1 Tax=Prochlorothrix hollandica PCC 9006 = CALU 1027 TaxID=317619 RepID=A0A0M2PWE0_PROHO|nr:Rieske (2Fe-2S) protein [Prochlorothrix hollandica]KKJ00761.1 hypothetical protein PROH_05735 [Prochlorothrix hollandica PCC 9006 = CALU 1027]